MGGKRIFKPTPEKLSNKGENEEDPGCSPKSENTGLNPHRPEGFHYLSHLNRFIKIAANAQRQHLVFYFVAAVACEKNNRRCGLIGPDTLQDFKPLAAFRVRKPEVGNHGVIPVFLNQIDSICQAHATIDLNMPTTQKLFVGKDDGFFIINNKYPLFCIHALLQQKK